MQIEEVVNKLVHMCMLIVGLDLGRSKWSAYWKKIYVLF